MKQEEILKKAADILNHGEFGSLSDFEVTTHVAMETAEWTKKVIVEKSCKWMQQHGITSHVIDAFRKDMGG